MKHKNNSRNFFSDWQQKIICLLLAVMVILIFTFHNQKKRIVAMPLEIILPESYTPASNIPDMAKIIISGSEEKIYMIDISKIRLVADFSGVNQQGVATVAINVNLDDLPEFLQTTDVSIVSNPSIVRIMFE